MRLLRQRFAPCFASLIVASCAGRAPEGAPKTAGEAPTNEAGPSSVSVRGAAGDEARSAAGNAVLTPATEGSRAARAEPVASTADRENAIRARSSEPTAALDAPVADEPIYFPGARARPKGSAVDASHDDELVATWNHGGLGADTAPGNKAKPPHAAPRVKVDVIEVHGDATEADMQRALRLKSYWPFRICYEQGLRRAQKLHGTIKLRLTIGPSGYPSGVQQLGVELGDPGVVSCVVKSAMALGLPAPSSGAPQVTLDISLWPGDEPVSIKAALHGKSAVPAEATALGDALHTHLSEVRTCYAAGLKRHDGLWGRLALSLKIAAGAVTEASETESHFPDPEVTECARKAFLGAAVPSSEQELVIVYPLRLGQPPDARDARR